MAKRLPPVLKRKRLEYCVATGSPSYRSRAGHGAAGLMCFNRRIEAKRYLARVKRLRPDDMAYLTYPRPRSQFIKPSNRRCRSSAHL